MTESDKSAPRRGFDALGVVLLGTLALGAVGGGVLLVQHGEFTASGLLLALVIGGAFVFAAGPSHRGTSPKNTLVHGAARPASEDETRTAARGVVKQEPAHENRYPD
jgi:predicted lipid-binding transport protein (Tim44 family)